MKKLVFIMAMVLGLAGASTGFAFDWKDCVIDSKAPMTCTVIAEVTVTSTIEKIGVDVKNALNEGKGVKLNMKCDTVLNKIK